MRCPNCGKDNPEYRSHCQYCRSYLDPNPKAASTQPTDVEQPQRWEYFILVVGSEGNWLPPGERWDAKKLRDGVREELNRLGSQGWEMTGTISGDYGTGRLYFKRPRS
jgi:hypothetical protein